MPDHKFINNSQLLQNAFLDKIIEDSDLDAKFNNVPKFVKETTKRLEKQRNKIDEKLMIANMDGDETDYKNMKAFNAALSGTDAVN